PPLVQAACAYCLISLIDPQTFVSQGLLRAFTITAREGSVLNPRFPAPVNTYNPTVHALVDAVYDALSNIVPDKVRADGSGIRSMKHIIPPNGCAGGKTGRPGDIWINPDTATAKRLPTRYADYPLKAGDIFRLDTPGGGGHGEALAREPERVLADVREGCVSPEAAARDYGVVLRREGGAWVIDQAATAARRATKV